MQIMEDSLNELGAWNTCFTDKQVYSEFSTYDLNEEAIGVLDGSPGDINDSSTEIPMLTNFLF